MRVPLAGLCADVVRAEVVSGVLRAVGFTSSQSVLTLTAMALVIAVIGAAVGAVFGLVAGNACGGRSPTVCTSPPTCGCRSSPWSWSSLSPPRLLPSSPVSPAGERRTSTSPRCCGPSDRGKLRVASRCRGREPACSPPSLTRPAPCAVSRAPMGCSRRRRWSPRRTARSPLGSRSAPSTRSSSSEGTWPSRGGVTRATPTGLMDTPIRPAAAGARRLRRFRYGLTVCVLALERLALKTASPL